MYSRQGEVHAISVCREQTSCTASVRKNLSKARARTCIAAISMRQLYEKGALVAQCRRRGMRVATLQPRPVRSMRGAKPETHTQGCSIPVTDVCQGWPAVNLASRRPFFRALNAAGITADS
jgi:hypothetical protein